MVKPPSSEFESLLKGFAPAKDIMHKQIDQVKKEAIESVKDEEEHIRRMVLESQKQEEKEEVKESDGV
jgi:hypothetical protein